jgi:hypothetical protein
MLRRYLIVNGISTVLMYGAVLALLPAPLGFLNGLREGLATLTMENPVLAPLFNGLVLMSRD